MKWLNNIVTYPGPYWAAFSRSPASPVRSSLCIKRATKYGNLIHINEQNPVPRVPHRPIIRRDDRSIDHDLDCALARSSKHCCLHQKAPLGHVNGGGGGRSAGCRPCFEEGLRRVGLATGFCTEAYHVVSCIWWGGEDEGCEEEGNNEGEEESSHGVGRIRVWQLETFLMMGEGWDMNIYNVRLCVRLLIQYSFRAKVITIWKSYDMYGWHVISSKGQWYPIRFMFFLLVECIWGLILCDSELSFISYITRSNYVVSFD